MMLNLVVVINHDTFTFPKIELAPVIIHFDRWDFLHYFLYIHLWKAPYVENMALSQETQDAIRECLKHAKIMEGNSSKHLPDSWRPETQKWSNEPLCAASSPTRSVCIPRTGMALTYAPRMLMPHAGKHRCCWDASQTQCAQS